MLKGSSLGCYRPQTLDRPPNMAAPNPAQTKENRTDARRVNPRLTNCLCAIALIQNDTPTSKMISLLEKRYR